MRLATCTPIMTIAVVILLALLPRVVVAQFYSWTDEKGVTHFSNDPNTVPERYRSQVKIPPPGKGTAPSGTPPGWTFYQKPAEGFSIALPSTWKQLEMTAQPLDATLKAVAEKNPRLIPLLEWQARYLVAFGGKLSGSGGKFIGFDPAPGPTVAGYAAHIHAFKVPLSEQMPLNLLVQLVMNHLENRVDVAKPISHRRVNLTGSEGEKVQYRVSGSTDPAPAMAITQFLLSKGQDVYTVTLTTTADQAEKYAPIFEKIGQSFRVPQAEAPPQPDLRQLMQRTTEQVWDKLLFIQERRRLENTQVGLPPDAPLDQAAGREAAQECEARFANLQGTASAQLEPFVQCYVEKVREKHLTRHPLCFEGMRKVTGPWDWDVQRLYKWLWPVVWREASVQTVEVFVIDSPQRYNALGAVCSDSRRANIVLWLKAIEAFQSWPDPEAALAHVIAHEFAHIVLHGGDALSGGVSLDRRAREYEADELGVYYFERAGYDCRRWVELTTSAGFVPLYDTAENVQQAVKGACDLAKAGKRPARRAEVRLPLPPESAPTRSSR
ncbi:MAG: DUF4124 domain-containing protein [Nitrospinae bacterium]|nr:DUF4124 domain-containing protein [Nitrospinota bacterium]